MSTGTNGESGAVVSTATHPAPASREFPFAIRAIFYGFLSLIALFSAFWLNAQRTEGPMVGVVVAFWLLYLPFFFAYCGAFAKPRPSHLEGILAGVMILEISGFSILYFVNGICRGEWLPPAIIGTLVVVALLIDAYGFYLLHIAANDSDRLRYVRHQLTWPALLVVGVPIYIGLRISDFSAHLFAAVLPLLLVVALIVGCERKSVGRIRLVIAKVMFVGALLILLAIPGLKIYFATMLYCVIVTVYLASFDAWSVTANLAKEPDDNKSDSSLKEQLPAWYLAAMAAIIFSLLMIPAVYVYYKQITAPVLGLFVMHSWAAFLCWNWAWDEKGGCFRSAKCTKKDHFRSPKCTKQDHFRSPNWTMLSIVFGVIALLLPAIGLKIIPPVWENLPPGLKVFFQCILPDLRLPESPDLFGFLVFLAAPPLLRLSIVFGDWSNPGMEGLFKGTDRVYGVLFYGTLLGIGYFILARNDNPPPSEFVTRATHACTIYLAYWVVAYFVLILRWFASKPAKGQVKSENPEKAKGVKGGLNGVRGVRGRYT